ncbi:MAG: hypothetical protein QNI91_14135 [Arenicellales bacterium]|nr:hypothetical protein [Arenicellales bacterium]
MTKNQTVTVTQIDQLRAGLLDDSPKLKAKVESALHQDPALSAEYDRWNQVREQLESSKDDATKLQNQLRLRRRAVLSGKVTRKPRRFTLPQMALATATSVALTLGLVLWINQAPYPNGAANLNASTPTKQATGVTSSNLSTVDFDLTNNVDFYVWIERQSDLFVEVPRKGT